jgi:hypothetical protein
MIDEVITLVKTKTLANWQKEALKPNSELF